MSSHYANPDNALSKATALSAAGKYDAAIDTLHSILGSRRHRMYQPTHEKIMALYVKLALRQRHGMRDAFVKFRNICQEAQIASLEAIIRKFRDMCEKRAAQAKEESAKALESDENKADLDQSPESLLIQLVSGEDLRDRRDKQILQPWVKYLWEGYRTILEVLRNNAKLQELYHETARRAFQFCCEFKRNVEFRSLCKMLRQHIMHTQKVSQKYSSQSNSVDLFAPETQKLYLETRFNQLEKSSQLELWQEAYRTIEDIHESMVTAKTDLISTKPGLMKLYYDKLAQIFWASGNLLFHAYCLRRYYELSVSGGLEGKDKEQLASAVVLATLSIPPHGRFSPKEDLFSAENSENLRLANMLGFKKEAPTRRRLLNLLLVSGILQDISPEVKEVYTLVEVSFCPLKLTQKLKPLLAELSKFADDKKIEEEENKYAKKNAHTVGKYVAEIRVLATLRMVQQMGTVFKTVRLANFRALSLVDDPNALERLLVDAGKSGLCALLVDHARQVIIFREATIDSPKMKNQLVALSDALQQIVDAVEPAAAYSAKPSVSSAKYRSREVKHLSAEDITAELAVHGLDVHGAQHVTQQRLRVFLKKREERSHVFKLIRKGLQEEHDAIFKRHEEIEKRKQQHEREKEQQEELDKEKRKKQDEKKKKQEDERLKKEADKRKEKELRKEKEQKELEAKQKIKEQAAMLLDDEKKSKSKAFKKLKNMMDDVQAVDKEEIDKAMNEVLLQEKADKDRKLRELIRFQDYFVRAKRMEEKGLLREAQVQKQKEQRLSDEADFKKYQETKKKSHDKAMKEKKRLSRMQHQVKLFMDNRMEARRLIYDEAKARQDAARKKQREEEERERARRKAEEEQRLAEEERVEKERLEQERKEEAARRKEEEARRKVREEEERKRDEERQRAEDERRERMEAARERQAKNDAIAEKQRQREQEVADKRRREREERSSGGGRPGPRGGSRYEASGADDRLNFRDRGKEDRGDQGDRDDRAGGEGKWRPSRGRFNDRGGGREEPPRGGKGGSRDGGSEERWRPSADRSGDRPVRREERVNPRSAESTAQTSALLGARHAPAAAVAPAPVPAGGPVVDDDGFTTVAKKDKKKKGRKPKRKGGR